MPASRPVVTPCLAGTPPAADTPPGPVSTASGGHTAWSGHEKARPSRDGRRAPAVPPALRRCPTVEARDATHHATPGAARAASPVMALPLVTVGAPAGPTGVESRDKRASRVRSAAREGSSLVAAAPGSHRPGLAWQPLATGYSLRLSLYIESRSAPRSRSIGRAGRLGRRCYSPNTLGTSEAGPAPSGRSDGLPPEICAARRCAAASSSASCRSRTAL